MSHRPYNYKNKNRSKNNKNRNRSKSKRDINLENTVKIRIDSDRINDLDSLDTSFLEGRVKNTKKKEKLYKTHDDKSSRLFKDIIYLIILIIIIVGVLFCIVNKPYKTHVKSNNSSSNVIDNNYLFVGDFTFNKLNLGKDYHYIKDSSDGETSSSLYDDISRKIYEYNPSHVFISIGINDLSEGRSIKDIDKNIEDIIKGIKENRSYAKIYFISVNPINKDIDDYDDGILDEDVSDKLIKELNSNIKSLCKKYSIGYIDTYSALSQGNKLDSKYTDNGVYLNREGNRKLIEYIKSSSNIK